MARTDPVAVPVIVDSVKIGLRNLPDRSKPGEETALRFITRCNYLSVECDYPKPDWSLRIGGLNLPFLMLGLTGVIHRPFDGGNFDTPDKIEDLFIRVEKTAELLVNINDVWLPTFLFEHRNTFPKKGQVYRVRGDLFSAAFLFREGRLGPTTFMERCHGFLHDDAVSISEIETAVFTAWHKKQIDLAIHQYPKKKDLALRYRE